MPSIKTLDFAVTPLGRRGPLLDDTLDRAHPVGERRGSRLQDERRLDLADVTPAHRGDRVPPRARGGAVGLELLAAPAAEPDVVRTPGDRPRSGAAAIAP